MCDNPGLVVLKSNSAGNLLLSSEMTLIPSSAESPSADPSTVPSSNELPNNNNSKLRRTFTLPRNPFNSTRMSSTKRRTTSISTSKNKDYSLNTNSNETEMNEADKTTNNNNNNNKKVFRRPSLRKFINRIAQHIGGVPGVIANTATDDNNRVPPLGGLQTWGPEDTPGVTGLKNHGNTCFINAVLQCISHTDVLAEYFVLDRYKIDLSRRNKLNSKKFGTKGEVTEQLALLLKALWSCQYSPDLSTSFKQVVERHGAQYKGNQQHDALEFLQWLLDKVHEDLNTASKRKYKSIKTSGRPDEVIAAETLENYKRCNNSFIQGIFQAQYRSSLSCSRCRNQSNTFDPFQCISVQLPQFTKQSIYVTVLYTSQQPRQVQIGLSMPSGATISELRDILESDTSIERANMLITEIGESGFLRTFTDTQVVNIISEIDPIYCIEVAQLKDPAEDDDSSSTTTSAYVLLCWINVIVTEKDIQRFGSPYTMQVSRETSYEDLQKLILKEMAPILHDDVLTSSQPKGIFKIRISDPACNDNEPPCYLEPDLEHPLFTEAVDQALALCSEEGGPPHVKLVMEFAPAARTALIADDTDLVEEHSSVKQLRMQAVMHGGSGGSGGGGPPLTLEECLRDYTEAETLTDAWRCPNCQQYQPVVKTLDMWSLPDILVVHFKRFRQQTLRGCNNSAKLTTMVDFPVYNLDMTPHLAKKHHQQHNHHGNNHNNSTNLNHHHNNHHHHHSSHTNVDDASQMIMHQQQLNGGGGGGGGWSPWKRTRKQSNASDNVYDLYAICYHHGSDIETGHYTAACKNPYDQQWYLYDDAKVTNLSKQTEDIATELVNNSAYILFYQKRNGTLYINNGSYSNGSYGSSSNSASSTTSSGTGSASNSSAASTSSVGSSSVATSTNSGDSGYAPLRDHWVSRMPKFVPPSCANNTSNANGGNCNTNNSNNNSTNNNKNNTLRRGQQQQQDCAQQTKKENDDVSNNKQNNGCVKEDSVTANQHGDCQLLSSSAATTDKDDADDSTSLTAQDTKVALRNSQNTLHSSQTSVLRKSLEHKSTNTNLNPVNNSQATSSSTNNLTNSQSPKTHNNHHNANRQANEKSATFCQNPTSDVIDGKKTLYTTSIYIDSCGDANISTKSTDRNFSDVVDNDDVMSTTTNQRPLRLGTSKGAVAVDNVDEPMTNGAESNTNTNTPTTTNEVLRRTYTTTAAVHRYSDVNRYYCNSSSDRNNVSKTHLNWMSPQPLRKLNQSQQSM